MCGYICAMVVYQAKRIKFGIIARSRAYGQFGCLVSTCQNCQTSFQNSHLKRKSFHNKRSLTSKNKSKTLVHSLPALNDTNDIVSHFPKDSISNLCRRVFYS